MPDSFHEGIHAQIGIVNDRIGKAGWLIFGDIVLAGFSGYLIARTWMGLSEDGPFSLFALMCYLAVLRFVLKVFEWHALWIERRVLRSLVSDGMGKARSVSPVPGRREVVSVI